MEDYRKMQNIDIDELRRRNNKQRTNKIAINDRKIRKWIRKGTKRKLWEDFLKLDEYCKRRAQENTSFSV